ncbi:hypothetical protein EUGRSUZ_L01300 [Eucalyptus grandis]|uniref:Neprosin PEP catalytic domain-containing protein n=1 Tax=Eucalyptus grandis TaxID=71139 RepID=A0A058ZTG5_EUCGR|nr:hypothetical protein EUGRSUZ_L01300 [Eucalyptus grandis]
MGARATINLWNPAVVYPEVSFSQIWLEAGPEESLNTVETGWLVDTVSYPRNQAKMFTFYTGSRYAPNNLLLPVSIYDGPQVEITIAIWKDQVTGDWWLRIQDENVGYWHKDLFTHLKGPAEAIHWGGEIVNTKPRVLIRFGGASYFRHLKFLDDGFIERDPVNLQTFVTKPNCYDLLLYMDPPGTFGVNFYYGGPGFSSQCPI